MDKITLITILIDQNNDLDNNNFRNCDNYYFLYMAKKSNINSNDENTDNNSDEQKPSDQNDSVNEQQPEQTGQDEETKYYTVTFKDQKPLAL